MLYKQILALRGAASGLAVAGCLTAGSAFASGPVTVVPPEIVYTQPAPAFDWAGAYGGLSYSAITSEVTVNATPPSFNMPSEGAAGVFFGYNWQRGNFVYGGEVNYSAFEGLYTGTVNTQRDSLELRARVGYAMDRVLVYGFVGAAQSTITSPGIGYRQNGYSFGVGVQAHVGRNVFVGVEASRRDVSGAVPAGTAASLIDALSLRVGYQF